MFLHIGDRKSISDKKVIGVFNIDTIKKSSLNSGIKEVLFENQCDIRTIVIDIDNNIISSKVSPYTVIKRTTIYDSELVWRKK